MMQLVRAVLAIAIGGVTMTVIGQSLPRRLFDPEKFPYKTYGWEAGGRIYERVGVRRWKDKAPDLSRIIPGMVKKKAVFARTPELMDRLIRETCVAEFVHWVLATVVSLIVALQFDSAWGLAAGTANALGNLVFIIIQRYNRPRLKEIMRRMEMRRR